MLSKIVSFFCVLSLTSMSLGGPLSEVSQKKIARIDQLNSNIETQKNNVVDAVVLQIMQINNRSQVLQANDLVTSMNKTVEQIRNLETNAASTINEVRSQYNEIKLTAPFSTYKNFQLAQRIKEFESFQNNTLFKNDLAFLTAIANGSVTRVDDTTVIRLREIIDRSVLISNRINAILKLASEIEVGLSLSIPGL